MMLALARPVVPDRLCRAGCCRRTGLQRAAGKKGRELADIGPPGKANVVTGEVPGPGGTTMIATTVSLATTPTKSFTVYWWDEDKHEHISGLHRAGQDNAPGG